MNASNNEGGQNSKRFFKLPSWLGSKSKLAVQAAQNPIIPSMAEGSQQFFNAVSANTPQGPTALHKVNNVSLASNANLNSETHSYALDSVSGNGASIVNPIVDKHSSTVHSYALDSVSGNGASTLA